jgi:hypothetical protein
MPDILDPPSIIGPLGIPGEINGNGINGINPG